MAVFRMKIAGLVGQIHASFDSTIAYCQPYLTEESPDFSAEITPADREFEQEASWEEAREEGIRPRTYTGPHLERSAIQRKFAEQLFLRDTLMVHGSCVAVDGQAFLFTAKCGTGKSTHTRLWCRVFGDRAVMVNDDKPFLQITEDGVFACGSPWCGKHGLGTNVRLPLKGICILDRGPENQIRPLSPEDAMSMLLHQSYRPLDSTLYPQWETTVATLAQKTSLWHLHCNKEPQAAMVSHAAMSK